MSKSKKQNRFDPIPVKKSDRTGHNEHRCGSGEHSSDPKRERTRKRIEEKWKKDYEVEQLC